MWLAIAASSGFALCVHGILRGTMRCCIRETKRRNRERAHQTLAGVVLAFT